MDCLIDYTLMHQLVFSNQINQSTKSPLSYDVVTI